ncbi:hypothetical protein [Streptomyces zhihengii]
MRTVCPQCGTRHDEWDHGGPDEEDQYVATVQRCAGCEVIADRQKELERDGSSLRGVKVGLMPIAAHAALEAERALKRRARGRRDWDEDDD